MKLCDLYGQLTTEEREALAKKVDTDAGYLWQLATQWRGKKPSIDLLSRLAAADQRLSVTEMVEEFSDVPIPKRTPKANPQERSTDRPGGASRDGNERRKEARA